MRAQHVLLAVACGYSCGLLGDTSGAAAYAFAPSTTTTVASSSSSKTKAAASLSPPTLPSQQLARRLDFFAVIDEEEKGGGARSTTESPTRRRKKNDGGEDIVDLDALPPVLRDIVCERREYQMNLGRAMDTLRSDMETILVRKPGTRRYSK